MTIQRPPHAAPCAAPLQARITRTMQRDEPPQHLLPTPSALIVPAAGLRGLRVSDLPKLIQGTLRRRPGHRPHTSRRLRRPPVTSLRWWLICRARGRSALLSPAARPATRLRSSTNWRRDPRTPRVTGRLVRHSRMGSRRCDPHCERGPAMVLRSAQSSTASPGGLSDPTARPALPRHRPSLARGLHRDLHRQTATAAR